MENARFSLQIVHTGRVRKIIMILLAAVTIMLVAKSLIARRGAGSEPISLVAPVSDESYCEAARTELRALLAHHGFTKEAGGGRTFYGMRPGLERVEWFAGNYQHSLPFNVIVCAPQGESSGVQARVEWQHENFSWRIADTEKGSKAFTELLAQWWLDYQKQHRRETHGPNKTD
jgi:hypothetical protein